MIHPDPVGKIIDSKVTDSISQQHGFGQPQWRMLGGQLCSLSWRGQPLFYVSPRIRPDQPLRGGVPVLFPQFGPHGYGQKHGLARRRLWQAASQPDTYYLHLPADPQQHWPGEALLTLGLHCHADTARLTLTVKNTGDAPFSFTGGLHPYFQVSDLGQITIDGLGTTGFDDRYDCADPLTPVAGWFHGQAVERLYHAAPALSLQDGRRRLDLQASGFHNWMIWQPGEVGGRHLADLPNEDINRFICIEPVWVKPAILLAAGEQHEGCLQISLSEE